jgi:hypothetical protein
MLRDPKIVDRLRAMFTAKQKEKRIAELRNLITVQSRIMEAIAIKRGEYFLELAHLED